MFTCSAPEDLLFPLDSPSIQQQKQQYENLQKRCLKLEKDCQKYEEIILNLKVENENKFQLFIHQKEKEFHQIGTKHAINLQDLENKFLHKLQNRSDDIIDYQIQLQEKSNYIHTLTNEIEILQQQNNDIEKIYNENILKLNGTIEQLQSLLAIEIEKLRKLTEENQYYLLSMETLQHEKDELVAQIHELLASKDAVVHCIQKLNSENSRLKQKIGTPQHTSPRSQCVTLSSPAINHEERNDEPVSI